MALCVQIHHNRLGFLGLLMGCTLTESLLAGDPSVGKSSLLVRLTDQRFLANPEPTVRLMEHTSSVFNDV